MKLNCSLIRGAGDTTKVTHWILVGASSYKEMGYLSVLHAIYQVCIRHYILSETIVLEIGPGRGTWTKTMLGAKDIWCLDALSAEHNKFWEHIGNEHKKKVKYEKVTDLFLQEFAERLL